MLAIDLHIHSGLSPCAENDMTPNNIIRMAQLKKLDVIAITDHNSTKNLKSFLKVAEAHNILCIPGVEITTKEEVHLLALFDTLSKALEFQDILNDTLPKVNNNAKVFGNQYIYDEEDNIIEDYSILLLNALTLNLKEAIDEIFKIGGVPIPAHIDRKSFSILSNLGFISPEFNLKIVEITYDCNFHELLQKHPYLSTYKKIINSDAHSLGNILEPISFIEGNKKEANEILANLFNYK